MTDQPGTAASRPSDATGTPPALTLAEAGMSPFFRDADRSAARAQQRHLFQTRLQLILLVLAAFGGALTVKARASGPDYAGVVSALAFLGAIFVRLYAEQRGEEKAWYENRAAAESAKTLCWRFAVGGNPFPEGLAEADARWLLVERFDAIGGELTALSVQPVEAQTAGEVTPEMLELRRSTRCSRIEQYRVGRIADQQAWYARRAAWNAARARTWLVVVLGAELVGLVGAAAKATGGVAVDLLGICAAVAAGGAAWVQTKQHRALAAAYTVTAGELRRIMTLVDLDADAAAWADFVDQAEEAISREHTMWVASRTGRHGGTPT